MKWLIVACLLACSGCVTTLETRWSENAQPNTQPDAEIEAAQMQVQQWKSGLDQMIAELTATTNEIEAVNSVLRKYGIKRP